MSYAFSYYPEPGQLTDRRIRAAVQQARQDYWRLRRHGYPKAIRELVCARIEARLERHLEAAGAEWRA